MYAWNHVDYSTSVARLFRGRVVAWFCNVDALNPYDLARAIVFTRFGRGRLVCSDSSARKRFSRFARLVPLCCICSLTIVDREKRIVSCVNHCLKVSFLRVDILQQFTNNVIYIFLSVRSFFPEFFQVSF